jgi:phage tail-like protein
MASPARIDPFTIGKFLVSIDGIAAGSFSEVSGLDVSVDVIDYREGNSKGPFDQKLPGLNHVSNVVLKRGLTSDVSLWTWINTVVSGNIQRRAVQITLLDQADNPVLVWRIRNAWPCKWSGPILNANSSEVAIETLEIAHEGLDLAPAG